MTSFRYGPRRRSPPPARRRLWVFRCANDGREIAVPHGLGELLFIMATGESIAKTGGRGRKFIDLAELNIPTEPGPYFNSIRLPDGHGWSFVTIRDSD